MNVDAEGGLELDELRLMWQSAPRLRSAVAPSCEDVREGGCLSPKEESPSTWPRLGTVSAGPAPPKPEDSSPAPSDSPAKGEEGVSDVPLERLEAQICALASRIAISCCLWLRLIAEFDHRKGWAQWGVKSCAHWLAWTCSVSPGAAREYVRVARDLRSLPHIRAAFAAGRLSYSKVRAISRAARLVDEKILLEQAVLHTASQLERVVRGYRRAQGAGMDQQRKRRADWFWDEDGMLTLRARLPADEGAIVLAALQSAEHLLGVPVGDVADHGACPTEPSDNSNQHQYDGVRSPAVTAPSDQLAVDILGAEPHQISGADALVAMAHQALAAGPLDSSGDDRQLLVLHADSRLFASRPADNAADDNGIDEPSPSPIFTEEAAEPAEGNHDPALMCYIENGPGVEPATAERLACDAALIAALWSSHGPRGEKLSLGRKTRKISAALRRALRIRDGGCRYPGCHRRRHLQAHHVVHWIQGGSTDLGNLVLLCRAHHMLLHEGGFTVSFGLTPYLTEWVFRRPDGVVVPNCPRLDPGPLPSIDSNKHDGWWPVLEQALDGALDDAELVRPGWRGERFSLVDSVGVWCQATPEQDLTARRNYEKLC